jgi:cytochrome c-type biogenesis protein CcmH/NrfG
VLTWQHLVQAHQGVNNQDQAIATCKSAIERNPSRSWAWRILGDAYAVKNNHDEAVEAYKIAIERDPTDSFA